MTQQNIHKKLFNQLSEQQISSDIETRVMIRIEHSRTIHARVYFILHISTIICATAVCIPVVYSFASSASQSGLTTYISLLSTDGMYILSSWKELGLSIVESMPIIETTIILSLVLVIGNALRRGTRYVPSLSEHNYRRALS